MPRLPSGREVVVDGMPLDALFERVAEDVDIDRLMAIAGPEDVRAFMSVTELVGGASAGETPGEALARVLVAGSAVPPPGLRAGGSGLSVAAALAGEGGWSAADRAALAEFLDEGRGRRYVEGLLADVREAQKLLADDGVE